MVRFRTSPGPSTPRRRGRLHEEAAYRAACAALRAYSPIKRNFTATADSFRVEAQTLRNRFLHLHQASKDAHQKQQLLTQVQEEVLVEWCIHQADEGRPWSREQIMRKVEKLCGTKPGVSWVTRFRKRHEEALTFKPPRPLDPKRAKAFCPAGIAKQFKKLGDARQQFRYKRWNIYNFDETGMQIGGGRKRTGKKYFFPRTQRTCYKQRDDSLELVTVIECACADGSMMSPGFIFEGKRTWETEWFEKHKNISVGLTPNGWTDDFQCLKWFKEVFIPEAVRRRAEYGDESDYIMLVFDGHGSHLADEMRAEALKHRIHFFKLRAHTTHKTQPLDVGVFGSMSKDWLARVEEIVEETGEGLQRWDFVNEYMAVRVASVTEQNVLAAFRKTGIEPFNPDVFTPADFAPSRTTSTEVSLPSSVPAGENENDSTPSDDDESDDEAAPTAEHRNNIPIDPILLAEELNQGCAVGADGSLLDASQIEWRHDPDDTTPLETPPARSSPTPPTHSSPTPPVPSSSTPPPPSSTSPCPSLSPSIAPPSLPPQLPSLSRTKVDRRWSEKRKREVLEDDLDRYENEYEAEFNLRQRRETELELCKQELAKVRKQLFLKEQKESRKDRQFQSDAEFLMGDQALAAWEESKAERAKKAAAEEEKRVAKVTADQETLQRRQRLAQDPTVRFKGSLKSKRKGELEDIAFLLALPVSGTNPEIVAQITHHLHQNPEVQADSRFTALFASLSSLQVAEPS